MRTDTVEVEWVVLCCCYYVACKLLNIVRHCSAVIVEGPAFTYSVAVIYDNIRKTKLKHFLKDTEKFT